MRDLLSISFFAVRHPWLNILISNFDNSINNKVYDDKFYKEEDFWGKPSVLKV